MTIRADVFAYTPETCDLCGSTAAQTVLFHRGRAMTSDSRIVDLDLVKLRCGGCGLVRAGAANSPDQLTAHYATDYRLAAAAEAAEPVIRFDGGAITRSEAIARWVIKTWDSVSSIAPQTILEIGCGEGRVLERICRQWPQAEARGLEPNHQAVELARSGGLKVEVGQYQYAQGSFDLIYAIAVIEHVPSAAHFIAHLGSLLRPGGVLVLMQPCQEDVSHDIFFIDHLHHFQLRHIGLFAAKAGLCEVYRDYPNTLLTHFSVHALRRESPPPASEDFADSYRPGRGVSDPIDRSVQLWQKRFNDLDEWLETTKARKLYVWGLGEFFSLLMAYTGVGSARIHGGFDDNIARYQEAVWPFPVTGGIPYDVADGRVLVTFRVGADVAGRLDALGAPWFCPLR